MLAGATRRLACWAPSFRQLPSRPIQAVMTRALQHAAVPMHSRQKGVEMEAAKRAGTAQGVLSKASDWLSPDDYSLLEMMPADESELPKLEQQQQAQRERQANKKQARRAMLEDVKQAVGERVTPGPHIRSLASMSWLTFGKSP